MLVSESRMARLNECDWSLFMNHLNYSLLVWEHNENPWSIIWYWQFINIVNHKISNWVVLSLPVDRWIFKSIFNSHRKLEMKTIFLTNS